MTKYIGPFQSEHGSSGREVRTELRVEPSEAVDGLLDVGIYRYTDGECIRILRVDKENATKLRDALDEYIKED